MSTGLDIQFVKKTYQRMPDEELIRIATQDASGLTPEATEIVKEEIKKRGLNQKLAGGVDAQNKTYTLKEVNAYCDIVSALPCPYCGDKSQRLNATVTAEVISVIFFTTYNKNVRVGCPLCLDKANKRALWKSAVLGWWGFPWGIIRTVQAITLNIDSKQNNNSTVHTDTLRGFALQHVGVLETYKENTEKLQAFLLKQNSL